MARRLATLTFLAVLLAAAAAQAQPTVICKFHGKAVQTILINTKDGQRACNAVCVWRYGNVAFRGAGGALLQSGETQTVFNSTAPFDIEAVIGSDVSCNR